MFIISENTAIHPSQACKVQILHPPLFSLSYMPSVVILCPTRLQCCSCRVSLLLHIASHCTSSAFLGSQQTFPSVSLDHRRQPFQQCLSLKAQLIPNSSFNVLNSPPLSAMTSMSSIKGSSQSIHHDIFLLSLFPTIHHNQHYLLLLPPRR